LDITFSISRDKTRTLSGEDYLKYQVLLNFFFNFVTDFGLLRHAGVNIGKVDYLVGSGN